MGYKFNRGCWVESSENVLFERYADSLSSEGSISPPLAEPIQGRPSPPSTRQKIELADRMFCDLREALTANTRVNELLGRLQDGLNRSRQAMLDYGIVAKCSACDADSPQGSCCSCGIEEKYDISLLLLNLLLGRQLPQHHERPESCYFLGPKGCKLRARHMLCIDYLCPELQNELGPAASAEIQVLMAGEVEATFLLCEEIKSMLRPGARRCSASEPI